MDWLKFLYSFIGLETTILLPLTIFAITLYIQGRNQLEPQNKKKLGKELIKLSRKLLILIVIIVVLLGISLELVIWLPRK
jgi:ABC-type uncharacterized transport system permease subunit